MSSENLRAAAAAHEAALAKKSLRRRLAIAAPLPVIVVLAIVQARRADPGMRVTADGAPAGIESDGHVRAGTGAATLRYSDGSTIELSPGAVVRIVATAPLGGRVSLETGRLVARVTSPSPMARWFFEIGGFEIVTPGGTIEVSRAEAPGGTGSRIAVALGAGQALVRGDGTDGGLPLRTDERVAIERTGEGKEAKTSLLRHPVTSSARAIPERAIAVRGAEAAALAVEDDVPLAYTAASRTDLTSGVASSIFDPARAGDPRAPATPSFSWTLASAAGTRLLFDTGTPSKIRIFRFERSETTALAVPAIEVGFGAAPALPADHAAARAPAWVWRDDSGDGVRQPEEYRPFDRPFSWSAAVSADGTVWRAMGREGIDLYACGGIDGHGVPLYRFAEGASQHVEMPPALTDLERLALGDDGAAYLTGYTKERPNPYKDDRAASAIGTELLRYDDLRSAAPPRWRQPLLVDAAVGRRAVAVTAAAGQVFLAYAHDPTVHVRDAQTGAARASVSMSTSASVGEAVDPAAAPLLRAFSLPGGTAAWLFLADPARHRTLAAKVE